MNFDDLEIPCRDRELVLIGGTFNPFTNAHKEMARVIRKLRPDALIVFVPTNLEFITGWKDMPHNTAFSGENRVEIITEATADIPDCFVSDAESSGHLSGKTYDLVRYMKGKSDNISICIGSDKLHEVNRWYRIDELTQEIRDVYLFTRGEKLKDIEADIPKDLRDKITEIGFDYPDVSSTLIRKLYEEGKFDKIRENVPAAVYEYLKEKRNAD